MELNTFYKKYGEPLTALLIVVFIVFAGFMMWEDRQIKEQINEQCGWAEEDYRCTCEKSDVILIENNAGDIWEQDGYLYYNITP